MNALSVRKCSAVAAVSAALSFTPALAFAQLPIIHEPVVAIVNNPDAPGENPDFVAIAITGSGFGEAETSTLKLKESDTTHDLNDVHTFPSDHFRVVVWTDTRIIVKLPPAQGNPRIWFKATDGSETRKVVAQRYSYDYLPTHSGSGNPSPNTLSIAGANGYLLEQWHVGPKSWNLATGSVSPLSGFTSCPGLGCFAVQVLGADIRTNLSVLGEDTMVDPVEGRIWFTQGGASAYTGQWANHSRIVSYQPSNGSYKIYNIPGDDNEISGLAWKTNAAGTGGRVWFSQRKRERCIGWTCASPQPAKLVSFDPAQITHNNSFDFEAASIGRSCPGGNLGFSPSTAPTVGTCDNNSLRNCFTKHDCVGISQIYGGTGSDAAFYHEYPVLDAKQIAYVAASPTDDYVWFTNYFGSAAYIGRLDVTTGTITPYPVHYTASGFFPVGPFQLHVAANGDVVFTHPGKHTVARLEASRQEDPACLALTSPSTDCATSPNTTCVNPCIEERVPPGFSTVAQNVRGLTEDADGRVWFNQGGAFTDNASASSVGFWTGDRSALIMFPSPQLYAGNSYSCNIPGVGSFGGYLGTDIAIDPATGDAWFNDYCRKRVGRLHRLDETPCE